MIEGEAESGALSWRTRLDLARSGLSQRLRDSGLLGDDLPPALRARAGLLLVLSSWSLFVVAGIGLQKTSEQWQAAVPQARQSLPAAAFGSVLIAAAVGSAAVVLGVLLVVRPLAAFLRADGWRQIRRPVVHAVVASGLAGVVLSGVVVWAHQLTSAQRNGGDWHYAGAFVLLGVCGLASVAAWTRAAVVTAGRLTLPSLTLRLETGLAAAVTLAMLVMTGATATWWLSVTDAAPGYFGAAPRMPAVLLTMLASSCLATGGSLRAFRASDRASDGG
ncbi:MAG: hypothetical protein ACXVY8_08885 [Gaiellaceae bacterium]